MSNERDEKSDAFKSESVEQSTQQQQPCSSSGSSLSACVAELCTAVSATLRHVGNAETQAEAVERNRLCMEQRVQALLLALTHADQALLNASTRLTADHTLGTDIASLETEQAALHAALTTTDTQLRQLSAARSNAAPSPSQLVPLAAAFNEGGFVPMQAYGGATVQLKTQPPHM